VLRTSDPRDTYERALSFLQADYFQQPGTFCDRLAAVLAPDSSLAAKLVAAGACTLDFDQFAQSYCIPCAVRALRASDPVREAAIWHNRLFNPALPDTVHVLALEPDWTSARADPEPVGRKRVV
jgi:hypothetical protein